MTSSPGPMSNASSTISRPVVPLVQAMRDAAVRIRPDILVLCHGGPIAEPEDAQYIFDHTEGIAGFFGASSIERLSVEPAIEEQTRRFKELSPSKG